LTHLIDQRCCDSRPPTQPSLAAVIVSSLALGWACLVPAPAVRAQIVYANPIPNEVKTSPNAITAGQLALISSYVDAEIANLKTGKLENEKAARKALEDGAMSAGDTHASGSYLAAYASVLDQKLAPLASANQPLPVRLNAAIALAHVAARANNGLLRNSAIAFTLDNSEPVALWGVKAGRYLVPRLLDTGQSAPLDTAIINAVARFKNDSSIVEDAYEGFTSDLIVAGPASAEAPPATRAPLAIDPLVKLMEMRAALYAAAVTAPAVGDGPDLPAEPQADNRGFSFISQPDVWRAAKPDQRARMCRAGTQLIDQIIPLVDPTPARTPNVDPPELLRRDDLIAVINQAGSAYKVIGTLTNEGAGGPIATAADMLTAAKVNAQTPGTTIKEGLSALEAALTAANLLGPAKPLPALPAKPVAPVRVLPTTVPTRAGTTAPASRPAGTPTASGAPVGGAR
jgi:hypothetical protein